MLCLNGHSITATAEEAAITISKTFTLTDCNDSEGKHYFKNDTTRNRWVPCGEDDKDGFCVEGGVITHSADGAVNGVDVKGTFIIYGGTICGHSTGSNSENNGAGVVVRNGSKFEMYGGAIRGNGNTGVTNGGGVYAYKDTSVIMNGGTISDNSVGYGSGLYIDGGTFTMTGGTISGNTAAYGSGLYIDGGILNMTGGTISGNKATCGSGVYMKNNAIINLSGTASISGNKATSDVGGVYIWAGTLNMTGGSISGNTADRYGGVYLDRDSATFNLSGTPVISGNQDTNGMASNVYVYGYYDAYSTGNPINITDALEEGAKIGVSPNYVPDDSPVYIAKFPTDMSENDRESCAAKFIADARSFCASAAEAPDSAYYVAIQPEHHEHYLCGGDECTQIGGHSCEAKTEFKAWTSTTSLPTEAGNWYLTDNVTVSDRWEPKDGTVLCLNGCTITSMTDWAIIVGKDTTFTLCDDRGEGKIGSTKYGSIGVFVNGKFNLYNGLITSAGGDASTGVYVVTDGTFTMYGGSITGNKKLGVRLSGGTFTMHDGSVTGNGNEGVSVESGSNFVMKGGRITQNMGGGVKMTGGTFDMSGNAEISDNTDKPSTVSAGGVCMNSTIGTATFHMSGEARIINNKVTGSGNRRDVAGGLLVEGNAKISISGNVQITGNKWNDKENNVLLWTEKYLDIDSKLEQTAHIGVDTLYEPIDMPSEGVEIVASGADDDKLDYTKIFTPDATDNNYEVIRKDSKLYLKVHQHSWNYKANGDTITAACACGQSGGSVTIAAPKESTLTYDGKAKEATLNSSLPDDVTVPTIIYKDKDGTESSTAPTNAGTYTASIKLGDATASVTYTIAKATLTKDDFDFTAPSDLTYNGGAKEATVAAKVNGMGTVTVAYYRDGIVVKKPTDAGTYTVKISVEESENYKAASELENPVWKFTIERNKNTPDVELSGDKTYTGKLIQPAVTVTVDGKTLTENTDYTVIYDEQNINAGKNAGKVTIKAAGNYAFEDVIRNFDIERAEPKLSFVYSEVTAIFGETYHENTLNNPNNVTVTYASSNEEVAKCDSNGSIVIYGAGETIITARSAETQNYKAGEVSYTLTVKKAGIRIDSVEVYDKVYDGSKTAKIKRVSFVNEKGQAYPLSYTATGTFAESDAGDWQVTVTVKLDDEFDKRLQLESNTFTTTAKITAKAISIAGVTAENRSYKLNDTSVKLTDISFKDAAGNPVTLMEGTDYTVTGEMNDANIGVDKIVNVKVNLLDKAANNYSLADTTTTTKVTISKATGGALATYNFQQKFSDRNKKTFTPDYGIPAGEKWTYSISDPQVSGSAEVKTCTIDSATGEITYDLSSGEIGAIIRWTVTISNPNYENYTKELVLTLTEKEPQETLRVTGDTTVVYGKTLTLGTTGGSGTGKVTYSIDKASSTGEATIDANGVLTPVKVGSITIIATKAGDANYNEATSAAFVITITKASPTGEPKYTVITADGKTLADAGLTLTGSTLKPAEGTLKWVDEAGNELSADTRVEVNKTYKWLFTPANDNYDILTGEMILYPVYQIIDGANSSWTQNTDGSGSIKIRGNGEISKFVSVMVDGSIIDPSNYTASEGSTIIELHKDYLKTLSEGIHTLAIVWTDGSASTNFTIVKNTTDDDDNNDNGSTNTAGSSDNTAQTLTKSPKTGDASGLWIALFAASAAGLAVMLVRRKKY